MVKVTEADIRFYQAEDAIYIGTLMGTSIGAGVTELADQITSHPWWTFGTVEVVLGHHDSNASVATGNKIALIPDHCNAWCLCHELAHIASPGTGHDAMFARRLIDLLNITFGSDAGIESRALDVFARLGISVAADIAGPGRICGDGAYAMHASRLHHRQYGAC